jgi:hypothetical protein
MAAVIIAVILVALSGRAIETAHAESSGIVGDWSGDSICQVPGSACKNEKVVYHISMSKEAGKVTVSADKIVDGYPVNMGTIDFDYDQQKGTLVNSSNRGVWRFKVHGTAMDGTLTLPDATVYRKISLSKQKD